MFVCLCSSCHEFTSQHEPSTYESSLSALCHTLLPAVPHVQPQQVNTLLSHITWSSLVTLYYKCVLISVRRLQAGSWTFSMTSLKSVTNTEELFTSMLTRTLQRYRPPDLTSQTMFINVGLTVLTLTSAFFFFQGNVYVKCPSIPAAIAAVNALHGRYFGGETFYHKTPVVCAVLWSESR